MIRLFVALRPPAPVREALFDVMDHVAGARWQDDDQLHLTLRFIGDIDRSTAEDVAASLAQIHAPALEVTLNGVGAFDTRGSVNTLWAGVKPREGLEHLHHKMDQACARAGLVRERRAFLPHITLARLSRRDGFAAAREIGHWRARHDGLTSLPFSFRHFVLFQSSLGRHGAVYEPVARWPLGTTQGLAGSQM